MRFQIDFYVSSTGAVPVRDFLDVLERGDPGDHAALVAGIARLRDRACHRLPLSRPLGDGLFELRHVGKLNTRVLFCHLADRRLLLLHAIRNKGRSLPGREVEVARRRRDDWLTRHP